MQTRLQVILARAGVASRRAAETLITEGKVSVNGRVVAELGAKADPERDEITVSGKRILVAQQNTYILLNKPAKYITTRSDPEERATVMELLPKSLQHLHPVGRLDWETEGALLFTDDGTLTHALTHPRYGIERIYHIKLAGRLGEEDAIRWLEGVTLEDGPARAETAEVLSFTGKHTWLQISLKEGRNREVRRLAEALRYEVLRLRRYSFAGISIEGVPPGGWRFLEPEEVERLREMVRDAGAETTTRPPASRVSPPVEKKKQPQAPPTGKRSAKSFDITPKGAQPTPPGVRGTTRVEGFDEEGNPIPVVRPRPPEEPPRSPHGTRIWVSDTARSTRPASSRNKEEDKQGERRSPARSPREGKPQGEARAARPASGAAKRPKERVQKETRASKRPGAQSPKTAARPPLRGKSRSQRASAGGRVRATSMKGRGARPQPGTKGRPAPRPKHRGKSRERG